MHKRAALVKNILSVWPSFVAPALLIGLWQIFACMGWIDTLYFPAPSEIVARAVVLVKTKPEFLEDIVHSSRRFIIAAVVAVPFGIILGVLMGFCAWLRRFLSPVVSFTYPLPKLAVMPFLMMFFGIGDLSKIILIGISIFYLVLLGVMHAVMALPRVYFDIIRVYRIGFLSRMYFVFLKGIFPDILNSCKLGLGSGVLMVLVSEFVVSSNGIGFFMWDAWDHFRIKDIYVGFFVVAFIGFGIFAGFDRLVSGIKWRKNNAASFGSE